MSKIDRGDIFWAILETIYTWEYVNCLLFCTSSVRRNVSMLYYRKTIYKRPVASYKFLHAFMYSFTCWRFTIIPARSP